MSHWWVPVGLGLLAGLALFLMVEQRLSAPLQRYRSCRHHTGIGWYCMRARGHHGACLPMRSRFGLLLDKLDHKLAAALMRVRGSHNRCPFCGRREVPAGDERACNCPF